MFAVEVPPTQHWVCAKTSRVSPALSELMTLSCFERRALESTLSSQHLQCASRGQLCGEDIVLCSRLWNNQC